MVPPALDQTQQEELKGAVEQPPATAGIVMANWYWKVVRQFVSERFGISLSRSSCLNWLHRLGFAFKLPKKRLLKADESKRETFVAEYAVLWEEAQRTGARIFFADEAHFRADAELRGKWVLKGKPALVDSSSPRYGEKASYYSAVCLETGEVEWMEMEGNSNSGTSVAFLTQLKEKHPGPLRVIWDNAPAHRGEAVREYLRTSELELRLVNLPGYSPDFNADEAVWGWAREEVTGNLCLGSRAAVQERVDKFLAGLSSRKDEVRRRCRYNDSLSGRVIFENNLNLTTYCHEPTTIARSGPNTKGQPQYWEIRRCNTRNLAGNPDSPQAVIFLTSITDVMMGSRNVLHTLSRRIRL